MESSDLSVQRWWERDGRDGDGDRDRDRDRDGISRWDDNVAHITLCTEPNYPPAYAPGLEHQRVIMSTLGDTGGQLYIYLERARMWHACGDNSIILSPCVIPPTTHTCLFHKSLCSRFHNFG